MRFLAILSLALISGLSIAKQPKGNIEEYSSKDPNNGEVNLYISNDQNRLYSIHFYKNVPEDYWNLCTPPRTEALKISDVKFSWRNEIDQFQISFGRFGDEVFHVAEIVDLPESRKWILSTLIKKGRKSQITHRGCGSSAITYLISIDQETSAKP